MLLESYNVHTLKDFKEGDMLMDKEAIMIRLRMVSLKGNREFQISHFDRKRVIATCCDKECKWRFYAVCLADLGVWSVSKYVNEHTCSLDLRAKER